MRLAPSKSRRKLCLKGNTECVYVVNCLHPELLSHIFILAQEQQETDIAEEMAETEESEASQFGEVTPIAEIVSQVSKRWRTVALDTANLWTKLDFSDEPPYHYSKLLLERSKGAPLNISLTMSAADNQTGIDAVMNLIVPKHSTRVTTLAIHAISFNQIDWILSRFITDSDELPPLIDLSLYEENETGESVRVSVGPEHLPRLAILTDGIQRLSLAGVQLPWHSRAFSNLTHLRFGKNPSDVEGSRPSEEQFIRFLNSSPQLRLLSIRETGIVMDDPEHPERCLRHPPIEMAALQTIELQEVGWHEISFVLHIIRAPTLTELSICSPESPEGHGLDAADDAVVSAIVKFLDTLVPKGDSTSTSPLEVLTLDAITEDELGSERLSSMLAMVPRLRNLSLVDVAFDDTLLHQMHGVWGLHFDQQEQRGNLCPHVTWLRISDVFDISDQAIYDCEQLTYSMHHFVEIYHCRSPVVSSRSRQGKPIATLKLIDIGGDDDNEIDMEKLEGRLRPFVDSELNS